MTRPCSLEPGGILVLDGTEGLLVRIGDVAGTFIPYEVEDLCTRVQSAVQRRRFDLAQ